MEAPDRGDRDDQDHEIAHDVDDACADDDGVLVEAVLAFCDFFGFADAFGYDCEDEGDGVEEVPVEDEPYARRGVEISGSFSG